MDRRSKGKSEFALDELCVELAGPGELCPSRIGRAISPRARQ